MIIRKKTELQATQFVMPATPVTVQPGGNVVDASHSGQIVFANIPVRKDASGFFALTLGGRINEGDFLLEDGSIVTKSAFDSTYELVR